MGTANLFAVAGAVLTEAVIVFIRGTYFPVRAPYWNPVPPRYYRLLAYSDFDWPLEKSLALLMVAYLVISLIFEAASKAREKAAGA